MSSRNQEISTSSKCVDVNCAEKGNAFISEITADSGIDSVDSCSATLISAISDPLPDIKHDMQVDYDEKIDVKILEEIISLDDNNSLLSSPISISPVNNDATDNLLTFDDCSVRKCDLIDDETNHNSQTKAELSLDELLSENMAPDLADNSEHSSKNPIGYYVTKSRNDQPSETVINSNFSISELEESIPNNLATSTASLNDNTTPNNITMCKSPYSRSAENISTTSLTSLENCNLNVSSKDLNSEHILSEFTAHKQKVTAMQKIPETSQKNGFENQQLLDSRYARLPKELLPQDLGSIVKNVHGIFSSVSGSLKSAYTHRVTTQKPVKPIAKPIPNCKLMEEIFEDEKTIDNQFDIQTNGIDKPIEEMKLNLECQDTDNNTKKEVLKLQIESLERVLSEQRKENASLRERVKQQVDDLQSKDQIFRELELKLDSMAKRVDQAEREKDAAVMRYAGVECAGIEARRAAARAAAAERAAKEETALLQGKIKAAHGEKQRICQLYDDKCHELAGIEKELAKTREDLKELEGRLKWTQSKLRMEMDAYKESSERAEKLSQQVSELEAGREAAAASATDSARARQLEVELKESQAALILARHEASELEKRLATTTTALDACRRDRDEKAERLGRAEDEVVTLKASNLRLEQEAAELAALRAQAALADTLSAELARESARASQAEEALSLATARAETCARREAAALTHAAALTADAVRERQGAARERDMAQALSHDNTSLRERITTLEQETERLATEAKAEAERRRADGKALARKVAELTEECAEASKQLEWQRGENAVLRTRHASAVKELNRELQRALKRCEQLEAKLPASHDTARTGSVSSLSSTESVAIEERAPQSELPDIQVREPDRQALIERIVSLQRAAARRAERCDFLEEHSRQLTAELRGKSRLLRHLMAAQPAGAVAAPASDRHKKELAALGGGAMAALYGGDPAGLTEELSLEITQRLQAVLEDALLKNITLKENIDTLGEEIARLKGQKKSETK